MDRINKMVQRNLDKMKSKSKKMNRNLNKRYVDYSEIEEELKYYKNSRKNW